MSIINRFIIRSKEIRTNCAEYIQHIKSEPLLEVQIKEYKDNRTLEQNAYLWGVVYPAIREWHIEKHGIDYTCEEYHEHYKKRFIDSIVKEVFGDIQKIYTTKGSKKKFNSYIEKLYQHYAEQGLYIPSPDKGMR